MKKYIVGFLAGAVFAISATAFADTIPSLIGKKVQAQYTVEINGKILNTVVVEGSNYAPVRSFSEAAGYEVTTEGKNVKVSEVNTVDTTQKNAKKITDLQNALIYPKERIQTITKLLEEKKAAAANATTEKDKAAYADVISQLEGDLTRYQENVKTIEAQLAELQQ